MELKDSCKLLLEKGTYQKVKCCKFFNDLLDRELVLHELIDHKGKSGVSDALTGVKMFGLDKEPSKVKVEEINDKLNSFVKHFTLEETLKEFEKWENKLKEKAENGKN